METHIVELEAEATRLLRALEAEKTARSEEERSRRRKVEEMTRELSAQACQLSLSRVTVWALTSRLLFFG
jgi:hypothetical protein